MLLSLFNKLPQAEAGQYVRPCVDIDIWVDAIVAGRPYDSIEAAVTTANTAAAAWTAADLEQALAQHPRIGEHAAGASQEAQFSRREQEGTGINSVTASQLLAGNRQYEERFGRVFLIRAAGRSAAEILAELQRRLANTPDAEAAEVADQLGQIAALRLKGLLES